MITVTKIVLNPAKDTLKSIGYSVSIDGDAASPIANATLPYRRQSAPPEVMDQVPDVVAAARSLAGVKDHDHFSATTTQLLSVEAKGDRYILVIAGERDLTESQIKISVPVDLIPSPSALAIQSLITAAEGLVLDLVGEK